MGSPDSNSHALYVFVDASNLWQAQKAKGKFFDYQKLLVYLTKRFGITDIKVFYYTAYPADGTRAYSIDSKHKFLTYLKKGLGFTVRKKELKRIATHTDLGDSIEEKGNMDVEMTIDAIHFKNTYQTAVLFTGDSDFLALITYLRNDGKKIHVFSSKNNVSRELKTGADSYTDVLLMNDDIWGRDIKRRSSESN